MNVAVGLVEGRSAVDIELTGTFSDSTGKSYASGRHQFTSEVTLMPNDPESCFALDDVVIGIGFHWERKERQVFRGAARIIRQAEGLTVINDVSLENYVASVISSEMSASCPLELLKAHAVISRSWLWFPKSGASPGAVDVSLGFAVSGSRFAPLPKGEAPPLGRGEGEGLSSHEILRWYGRSPHPDFDVCADDHSQRSRGIPKAFSPAAADAVRATKGEF